MSTHSPVSAPAFAPKRNSRRQHLFLLVTSIAIAIAVLSCPLTQDALSKTPAGKLGTPTRLLGRTVLAHTAAFAPDQGFWHAEGSRIVTVSGAPVRISGVNWSGFETTNMVPGGLKVQDYRNILRSIRASGYNTVRLPFSNQMIESPIVPGDLRFQNAAGKAINQDLADLDALQILDHIVDAAGQLALQLTRLRRHHGFVGREHGDGLGAGGGKQ